MTENPTPPKRKRGFAAMTSEQRRAAAARGGKSAHERGTAHEWTSQEASEAGRKSWNDHPKTPEQMADIGRGNSTEAQRQKQLKRWRQHRERVAKQQHESEGTDNGGSTDETTGA